MPQLREWMLHFPTDWTAAQALEYVRDVTMQLNQAMLPAMQALGPTRACAILLTVVANYARANPVYHEEIKDLLANVYDVVGSADPFSVAGAAKQ